LWLPQVGMALGCIGLAVGLIDAAVCRLRGEEFFAKADSATDKIASIE